MYWGSFFLQICCKTAPKKEVASPKGKAKAKGRPKAKSKASPTSKAAGEESDAAMESDAESVGSIADFSPEVLDWSLNRTEAEQWRDLTEVEREQLRAVAKTNVRGMAKFDIKAFGGFSFLMQYLNKSGRRTRSSVATGQASGSKAPAKGGKGKSEAQKRLAAKRAEEKARKAGTNIFYLHILRICESKRNIILRCLFRSSCSLCIFVQPEISS